jgi:hypothetical protein
LVSPSFTSRARAPLGRVARRARRHLLHTVVNPLMIFDNKFNINLKNIIN